MQKTNELMITAVTYGCQDVLTNAHKCFVNACRKLMQDAISVSLIPEGFEGFEGASVLAKSVVHSTMAAMANGDVSFSIHNGNRVLMFSGGEHCKTSFLYAFPGQTVDVWFMGE